MKRHRELPQKKYGIATQLAKYGAAGITMKRREIMEACKVSRPTVSVWENLMEGEPQMIPSDHLGTIARILGCKMEDLMPKPVKA